MTQPDVLPVEPAAQRALLRTWSRYVARPGGTRPRGVRAAVHDSWERSASAHVPTDLAAAPLALDGAALDATREGADWVAVAAEAVQHQWRGFAGEGHILSLFDADGRMLAAEGDAAALEGLSEINFRPGGDWNEAAVGTNGPGTALATGRPAHIIGAEHYCARWHRWHCAAVPIRDPVAGRVTGVLDISGFREYAHPHTLRLVLALGVAIEQALAAREYGRRNAVLQAFGALAARYPGADLVAFDRGGNVLGSSPAIANELVVVLSAMVRHTPESLPLEAGAPVVLGDRQVFLWFPVRHGRAVVGGCLLREAAGLPTVSDGIPFRAGDVPVYARRFFEAAARDLGLLRVDVHPDVYAALQAYHWPGNVRELKQVVRRVLNATQGTVGVRDLPRAVREAWDRTGETGASRIDQEDARLMQVVRESRTMAEAAARLGITRSTLYRRMERFGFHVTRVLDRDA
jgi:transcriptional regulator of acetoin/glycerol metabolism